jgi:hypothetical protein
MQEGSKIIFVYIGGAFVAVINEKIYFIILKCITRILLTTSHTDTEWLPPHKNVYLYA